MCSLLGRFSDGILAVSLDDIVGKAVLHDEAFEMLSLMLCWAVLGRDDRAEPVMLSAKVSMVMFFCFSRSCC